MNKFIDLVTEKVTPRLNKITKNDWISSIQDGIMTVLPFILVGSLISVINVLKHFIPGMPDLSLINTYSFGLIGIFLAFLVPYKLLEKKGIEKTKLIGALAAFGTYLMVSGLKSNEEGMMVFDFARLGAGGMFTAIIIGLFVSFVMVIFSKFTFFKDNETLPEFIVTWFDSMLPLAIILGFTWLIVGQFNIDVFVVLTNLFKPLIVGGNSLVGYTIIVFLFSVVYSFGVSPWIIWPIVAPILYANTATNVALVEAGKAATQIASYETLFAGWGAIGGLGCTLPVAIMMCFSKAKRIKTFGRATLIPSVFNINEPLVFGLPIAFNPIMMIPMWINGLVLPIITYVVLDAGLVSIPDRVFQLNFLPTFVTAYLITDDFKAIILLIVIFAVATVIWYPFFKAFEKSQIEEELAAVVV